jgi:hypothetical protein
MCVQIEVDENENHNQSIKPVPVDDVPICGNIRFWSGGHWFDLGHRA